MSQQRNINRRAAGTLHTQKAREQLNKASELSPNNKDIEEKVRAALSYAAKDKTNTN